MNRKLSTLTVSALVAIAALTGCSSTPSAPAGSADVHNRIKSLTDCTELQKEFDNADAAGKRNRDNGNLDLSKASTAYMETAFARQNELKCFG